MPTPKALPAKSEGITAASDIKALPPASDIKALLVLKQHMQNDPQMLVKLYLS